MKKATPAQLAARARFAEMARSGAFKKKHKVAKKVVKKSPAKKAVKRRGPAKVNAPSQATGKKPTKRLQARRRKNTKPGVFPNPTHKMSFGKYKVQCSSVSADGPWKTVAVFAEKSGPSGAETYARALSATGRHKAVRIFW